ncbi:WAP four-disulfide core domain protein 8-like isoform X1 [Rana temporaria]|uniref:WAP four-disulfide core domain protein 8-like isoform X1 n=1 Tax=Rana temporaria TaxID=8407 RepID=UPI001AAD7869|nr:WAP four-disulfide core domain protein 8-like isoform X1 [Rana temporaria]
MRPSAIGALSVLLGIILLQVAFAEKIGSCPRVYVRCSSDKNNDTCKTDEDCLQDQKCCQTCGFNCEVPVSDKPGSCPNIMVKCATPIEDTCKNDDDCEEDLKCCNLCGYNCRKPVPDKEGQCKFYETFAPCSSVRKACKGDAFCPNKQKCCNVRCTMECDDPQSEKKKGQCPYFKDNELVRCGFVKKTICDIDEDCGGLQKCCRELCTNQCRDPVAEKSGQCPHVGIPNTHARFVCLKINQTACKTDEDCGGQQKCCSEYCVNKCKEPVVVKPGSCPTGTFHCPMLKTNNVNNCTKDSDCEGKKKCCNKCGLNCEDPQ